MDETYKPSTNAEWENAHRSAFIQDVLSIFTRQPADLLPFEKVSERLKLHNKRYLGLQNVPLDHIVGSVGRYQDFTRAFAPRTSDLSERWRTISALTAGSEGLPPVELYKVGDAYFVRDGNHRVSVARQYNTPTIQAYVWEYETRVPLDPNTDVDDLLSKAARAAFLERTNLDQLCPECQIELTEPDGYEDLLYEIDAYQKVLSQIDEQPVSFEEAVKLWYAMRYTPVIDIMRQRGILDRFPERTEADLYLWLCRNQEELQVRYEGQVLMQDAADDLAERFGEKPSPVRQVRTVLERVAEGVGELGGRLVEAIVPAEQSKQADETADALLVPIRDSVPQTPLCRFQGTTREEWETWHASCRDKLWELLGVSGGPRSAYAPPPPAAEIEETVELENLQRELIWLTMADGLRVPAYLLQPLPFRKPLPAILVFPGHGTIDQTVGLKKSYQQENALKLAQAGFIVLTLELRGFGRLDAVGHLQIDRAARVVGRTWYGMLVQDALSALDYLCTRPQVDTDRIAATGIGAGGGLTMYTAALDERVQAALVHSYLSKYMVNALDDERCPCNDIPGIVPYLEMGDVAALLAPRPALFVNGRRDPTSSPAARQSFAIVHVIYQLLGLPRHARLVEPEEMGHQYDTQLAISWLQRWLRTT